MWIFVYLIKIKLRTVHIIPHIVNNSPMLLFLNITNKGKWLWKLPPSLNLQVVHSCLKCSQMVIVQKQETPPKYLGSLYHNISNQFGERSKILWLCYAEVNPSDASWDCEGNFHIFSCFIKKLQHLLIHSHSLFLLLFSLSLQPYTLTRTYTILA